MIRLTAERVAHALGVDPTDSWFSRSRGCVQRWALDKRTAISELLHGQDGQVVVLLEARELEQRRLDPLDGVVRTCRPRQHRLEPGLAEAPVAAPRVQHA